MSKKKKKKGNSGKPQKKRSQAGSPQGSGKSKAQGKEPERQSLGKVSLRFAVFLLVVSGIFYLLLDYAIGKNAMWKVWVLVCLPFGNLTLRRQFFQAPKLGELLKPTAQRLGFWAATFVAANGLAYLLFRLFIHKQPKDAAMLGYAKGLVFYLSPVFSFYTRLGAKAASDPVTLGSLLLASALFYYGCVSLFQLEKDHIPEQRGPIQMLPV